MRSAQDILGGVRASGAQGSSVANKAAPSNDWSLFLRSISAQLATVGFLHGPISLPKNDAN
jgi:hypothetical protein